MTQLFINNNTNNYDLYKEDISDLNQSQKHLLDYILIQGEKLDNIENNIEKINYNTIVGKENLIVSSNYNISYKSIVMGGIITSMFISPFGYLLGLKVGTAISLSGMVMGSLATYNLQTV
tara:strand:- start:2 stop:361 length:360 start_codon:yes stop_codon:yes gene_type:complete